VEIGDTKKRRRQPSRKASKPKTPAIVKGDEDKDEEMKVEGVKKAKNKGKAVQKAKRVNDDDVDMEADGNETAEESGSVSGKGKAKAKERGLDEVEVDTKGVKEMANPTKKRKRTLDDTETKQILEVPSKKLTGRTTSEASSSTSGKPNIHALSQFHYNNHFN
jgi:hypothetical protein